MKEYRDRHRAYMSNGRIIRSSERSVGFSWTRFIVCAAMFGLVWTTNPANDVTILRKLREIGWVSEDAMLLQLKDKHQLTNYGLFSLAPGAGLTRVRLHGLGNTLECSYSDEVTGNLCELAGRHMLHRKPMVWDQFDRPYTLHRILVWTLLGLALLSASSEGGSEYLADHAPFLSILLANPNNLLGSLLLNIWQANMILYPVWQKLEMLVSMQASDSLFHLSDNLDLNFFTSAVTFVLLAILANDMMRLLLGRHLRLQFEGLVSVGLGYLRGVNAAALNVFVWHNWGSATTPIQLTWLLLTLVTARRNVSVALGCLVANVLGYGMGRYQYEHTALVSAMRGAWASVENLVSSLFGY